MALIHNEATVIHSEREFSDCTLRLWNRAENRYSLALLRDGTQVEVMGLYYAGGHKEFVAKYRMLSDSFNSVKWTPSGHAYEYGLPTPKYDIVAINDPENPEVYAEG